jgi:hypothetical protein
MLRSLCVALFSSLLREEVEVFARSLALIRAFAQCYISSKMIILEEKTQKLEFERIETDSD